MGRLDGISEYEIIEQLRVDRDQLLWSAVACKSGYHDIRFGPWPIDSANREEYPFTMSIERKHVGGRMSQIVIHGDTVYLAGQVAGNNPTGSVAEQTREILGRIDTLLAEVGSDKSKLLSATIYLPNIADFDAMNEVWDAWVAPGNPPARACVEARLAGPDLRVEVSVVAAR